MICRNVTTQNIEIDHSQIIVIMKRRHFLSSIVLVLPGAIIGTEVFLSSCKSDVRAEAFSEDDIKLLNEIGETIIPASASSPGSKAAKVGEFMKVYVTDCYKPSDQEIFIDGIGTIKKLCKKNYGNEFSKLTISQKQDLLKGLEKEAAEHAAAKNERKSAAGSGDAIQTGKSEFDDKNKMKENSDHYFTMIKNLTLFGYFTSEPGATKALRYIQTPGSFAGDVPYKKGDKSWAS